MAAVTGCSEASKAGVSATADALQIPVFSGSRRMQHAGSPQHCGPMMASSAAAVAHTGGCSPTLGMWNYSRPFGAICAWAPAVVLPAAQSCRCYHSVC